MFTLFDLESLCTDEAKLTSFLEKYGLLSPAAAVSSCTSCDGPVSDVVFRRGKPHVRCKRKGCQVWIPTCSGSLMEASRLTNKQLIYLFFFWAHDCAGDRSTNMLGLSHTTVAQWSQRLRVCVANAEAASERRLGGRGAVVECDECEIGRGQKGLYGHKTVVKGDVWGAICRKTGKLFLDTYDKWEKGDLIERRFGPPSVDDVADLCASRIAKGSFLFTDGARAYEAISKKCGYKHSYVDHGHGQYAKDVVFGGVTFRVHTNTIDGCWGRLKTWLNARGGAQDHLLWENLKEFQWRNNLSDASDPFLTLLDLVRAGHFPF